MFLLKPPFGKVAIREGLYIPTEKVRMSAIQTSLTFFYYGKNIQPVKLYYLLDTHVLVPRNFLPLSNFPDYLNYIPKFESVDFTDNIKFLPEYAEVQEEAFESLVNSPGGILKIPCGYGKTVLSLKMIATKKLPALVIVHTTDLLKQWAMEAEKHLGITPTIIQGEQSEFRKSPITIAMLHTLAKYRDEIPEDMRAYYGVIVWDEVDVIGTPYFIRTADLFFGQRFGLSATTRRDGMDLVYKYHLGRVIYSHEGYKLSPKVFIVSNFNYYPEFMDCEPTNIRMYGKVYTHLSKCPKRRELVIRLINELIARGRKILVLGERKEELRELHEHFPGSGICVAEVDPNERRDFLANSQVIFGIRSLAKRGLDQPDLDTLVVLYPMSDPGGIQQSAGRILRLAGNEKSPEIYVLQDLNIPLMRSLATKMLVHLRKMGYDVLDHSI